MLPCWISTWSDLKSTIHHADLAPDSASSRAISTRFLGARQPRVSRSSSRTLRRVSATRITGRRPIPRPQRVERPHPWQLPESGLLRHVDRSCAKMSAYTLDGVSNIPSPVLSLHERFTNPYDVVVCTITPPRPLGYIYALNNHWRAA